MQYSVETKPKNVYIWALVRFFDILTSEWPDILIVHTSLRSLQVRMVAS